MLYGDMTIEELDIFNMNKIKYKKDCCKIQKAFEEKEIYLTLMECQELYRTYSYENFCAGWESGIEYFDLEFLFEILLPVLIEIIDDRTKRLLVIRKELEQKGYLEL